MKLFILMMFASWSIASAEVLNVQNASYKEAQSNGQYLSFDMSSWKLGMFKSSFKSYVKDFKVSYDLNKNIVSNINVEFRAESIDTENEGRNEKMLDFCFESKKFPMINVSIKDTVDLIKKGKQPVSATIVVRGKSQVIAMEVVVTDKSGKLEITGESLVGLKQLGIPDPSIAVASIEDQVKIQFKLITRVAP